MTVRRLSLAIAAVLAAIVPLGTSVAAASTPSSAGRFIITLDEGVSAPSVAAEYRRDGADVDFIYTAALNGFAGSMSDANMRALRADHRVVRIERDGTATASGAGTQTGATWGLDRIDQTSRALDGTYGYLASGAGVTAYIVDTGINLAHSDFGGRATTGYDAVTPGGSATDCNGHGTHVAGTVGGSTYGVAKTVSLVAVRVLDCGGSGTWSGVIAGLDWIVSNHTSGAAVANMSLGGGASTSVDDAVNRVIADGVTMAVAAGNGNQAGIAQDACGSSPARVPAALTIGATTSSDAKTSWSNYGSCVDFFAPGSSITSDWIGSTTETNTISGTSMATPHVAGAAALYLELAPTALPETVSAALAAATTKGIVTSSSTANNDLLYSKVAPGGSTEPAPTPTVTITSLTKGAKKKNGTTPVTVRWDDSQGTTGRSYDVKVNGSRVATVTGSSYTTNARRGTYSFVVCRASSTICSSPSSITV